MGFPAFVLSFLLGRLGSVLLYQATWHNGEARRFHPWGATVTFLRRPWPWLFHLPVLALTLPLGWEGLPGLHRFTWAAAGALALGAVGRWGAVDLGRFFLFDRMLVIALWVGLWFSPACLYPLLLACCSLQYTVSGWPLHPGYSNLLGFEFMRSTLCLVLAALLVHLALGRFGAPGPAWGERQALMVVLVGQAAGYVQQALAKSALGRHWYSWILENRLQCLAVNSWLRGWGARWIRLPWILALARGMSRLRVPLCAAVWLIEIAWLAILLHPGLAAVLVAGAALLHLAIWILTGLAGYHYLVSHLAMLSVITVSTSQPIVFGWEPALAGAGCILFSTAWVLLLRSRLFRAYSRGGAPGRWGLALDPADHLMAWWDGPYMRMYSYAVTTVSGRRYRFPVTRFSPYDTFLTDIHTHLMILGRDWDLDPNLSADRGLVRAGVWGLTVSREDRDRTYRWMDGPAADLDGLGASPAATPTVREAAPAPLTAFFQGVNRYQGQGWFRLLLRRPHFPGEDHVPDASPLASESLPDYDGSEPVTEVSVRCVKTLYRRDAILCLEDRECARLRVEPP